MADSRIDLYSEFYDLTDALTAAKVPYAVCGGIAVAMYGYPRFTRDIDILAPPEELQRVLDVAAQRGYLFDSGRLPMGNWDIVRVSKVIDTDLLTLDILVVAPAIQVAWDSRVMSEANGHHIPIVSLDGLKHLKLLAGRKQDLTDLEQLGLN